MNFCPECGTRLEGAMKFCPECGTPLDVSSEGPLNNIDHNKISFSFKNRERKHSSFMFSCSFSSDDKMTIDELLSLLMPQLDILLKLCKSYPDVDLYRYFYDSIGEIVDGFQNRGKSSLSADDREVLFELVDFWTLISDELCSMDFDGYKNEISLYRKYVSDLNYILRHDIGNASSKEGNISNNENKEDYDPSVIDEINNLKSELREMSPSLKRVAYDPSIDYRQELNNLIGLDKLKLSIDDHILDIQVQLKRKELYPDLKINPSFSCIFKGNPGTGKTSVARLLAGLLKQEGLISNGCYVEVDASNLVSGYIGFSAKVARLAALESFGGVLFIDEAYSLMNSKGNKSDQGAEVIDTLTPLMENNREKLTVILAGYDKEMDSFLQSANTGFPSRFKSVFQFEDYTAEELLSILVNFAEAEHNEIEPDAKKRLATILYFVVSQKDNMRQFANARTARNLYEYIRARCTRRIAKEGYSDLSTIKLEDVNLDRCEIDMIINK